MDIIEAEDDVITTSAAPITRNQDDEIDWAWIIALICFGLGALLILVGICRLCVWAVNYRKQKRYSKWWLRQMEHRRHLEEYSIRTGDAISVHSHMTSMHSQLNGSWPSHLNENGTFPPDEGPKDTSSRKDVEGGYSNNPDVCYVNGIQTGNYGIQNGGYVADVPYGGSTSSTKHKDMMHFW